MVLIPWLGLLTGCIEVFKHLDNFIEGLIIGAKGWGIEIGELKDLLIGRLEKFIDLSLLVYFVLGRLEGMDSAIA